MRREHVKKESHERAVPIDTDVENCSCSLRPSDVSAYAARLVNSVKPFSSMTATEVFIHPGWREPYTTTERPWKTKMRSKQEWEEKEAIRRLRLETTY